MQKLIAEIAGRLTWRVINEAGERDLEITSDPWSKTHTIKIPRAGADWRDIEYLHELAHATLAAFTTQSRVRLTTDDGIDVWEVR